MVKVVRPGYRKEVECPYCKALLSYNVDRDVKCEYGCIMLPLRAGGVRKCQMVTKSIICPECGNKIVLP